MADAFISPSAGDSALEFAVDLFDRIGVFKSSIVEHGVGGTITVATSGLISRYLLPDSVKRFNDTYPKARLRLLHRSPGEIVKAVRLNEVDLGLVHAVHVPEGVAFHPWKTFPAFVLLSLDHPLSRGGTPKFRELLNLDTVTRYPLIAPEIDDPQQYRVAKVLRDEGLPYNVGLEVGSFETVKHYVALGQGIAVVPGACLTEEDHDAFATIRIPDEFHGNTIYGIVLRTDKHLTEPLSGMLGILGVSLGSK